MNTNLENKDALSGSLFAGSNSPPVNPNGYNGRPLGASEMGILAIFIRSLLLTTVFSFAAPILLIGGLRVGLCAIGYFPGMAHICKAGAEQIWNFLAIFGSGQPLQGLVAIALTCSFVGALFDVYVLYSHFSYNQWEDGKI